MTSDRRLVTADSCYLHIIDMQENLMRQIEERDRVISVARMMLRFAEIMAMPVLANTQYRKGLGLYVPELEELVRELPRPDKVEFSAYANDETLGLIERLPERVKNVILVGVETHICIYQTAMGALARGMTPWIVSDGVSSRKRELHDDGLRRLSAMGANVGSAEMLIYELVERAGTSRFKKVLPLIVEQDEKG